MAARIHPPGNRTNRSGQLEYQRQQAGLKLYGYVIQENHLHFIAQAPKLDKCVASFKAYTARQIIDHL